jgi:hypothetical protein
MATLFKDLGKRNSDLLTKDFPAEKEEVKFEWKGATSTGVKVNTNFIRKKDGSVVGAFSPEYSIKPYGTTVLFDINTRRDAKLEVTTTDKLLPGLKTVITGNSTNDEAYGTLAADYRHEVFSVSASADYGKPAGSTLKGAFVVGHQNFWLGASADYHVSSNSSDLRGFKTTVGYTASDFDVTVTGATAAGRNEVGGSYFHRVNSDVQVGTEVTFDLSSGVDPVRPKLVFGTQYRYNSDLTLKGKFDTAGKLGVSMAHQHNANLRFLLSAVVDTNKLGQKDATKLGATITLQD